MSTTSTSKQARISFGAIPHLHAASAESQEETLPSTSTSSSSQVSTTSQGQPSIPFIKSKDTTNAEILLAMKSVTSHIPQRSLDDFSKLASKMFPDSAIANSMNIGRTKIGYTVNCGLAPYYKDKLMKSLKGEGPVSPKYVACFDESFNSVTNNKQFDVYVIYFDEVTKRVTRKYLTSQFVGHGDAKNPLKHFEEVLGKVDMKNLIQISKDGPNVNWKMLQLVNENRKMDPDCPELLLLGSCGLHVLHGGYQTAQESTDWRLKNLLKPAFSIFNKSPARRADYLIVNELHEEHTGKSSSYLFPMKYCGHRWLENGKAIKRIMDIKPKVVKYLNDLKEKKKFPKKEKDERFTYKIHKKKS